MCPALAHPCPTVNRELVMPDTILMRSKFPEAETETRQPRSRKFLEG